MTDRFRWHGAARLIRHFSAGPCEVGPVHPPAATVLSPEDGGTALAGAMALAGAGRAFRIGAEDQDAPREPTDAPCLETLTSGTSGQPRRILRTQASWTASFAVNARLFGLGPGARVAVVGRLVQSLALYAGVEGLTLGAEVHLMDALRPDRQRRALAAAAITHLYATPAQLRLLAEVDAPPLSDLCHVIVGGSKLDPALRAALRGLAPAARIAEFYGAAEASFVTLALPGAPEDSVGQAYPGCDVAIRDAAGAEVPPGGVGEVWVRSPYLFRAYADGQPGPARRDGDWLSVGEMGAMTDGVLTLAGRAGRMVTVADQNVFPEAIETFLSAQDGIARVAVLPRPDARRGQVLVAVAQGDPARTAPLLRAARARFGPLAAPRRILWRSDWPELPSGKTDLGRLLREMP